MDERYHEPVLVEKVLDFLDLRAGAVIVDGTLGGAGHAEAVLRWTDPDGRGIKILIGIDRDPDAIAAGSKRLAEFGDRVVLQWTGYEELPEVLAQANVETVNGIMLDLGTSRHQLTSGNRGMSLFSDGPLDMRMDASEGETAAGLLTRASEAELAAIFRDYGEERRARRVARAIVGAREKGRVPQTTGELRALVESVVPAARGAAGGRIHPATRVFMSLRIAVNRELERLERALEVFPDCLAPGGTVVALSYHSLEDRLVKTAFAREAKGCVCPANMPVCQCGRGPRFSVLTKKPVTPEDREIGLNPAARSAKLRAARRLASPAAGQRN